MGKSVCVLVVLALLCQSCLCSLFSLRLNGRPAENSRASGAPKSFSSFTNFAEAASASHGADKDVSVNSAGVCRSKGGAAEDSIDEWTEVSEGVYEPRPNSNRENVMNGIFQRLSPSRRLKSKLLSDRVRRATADSSLYNPSSRHLLAFSLRTKRSKSKLGDDDTSLPTHLVMFTGDNCDHCDEMEPFIERLEKELSCRVHRFNVWRSQATFKLFEKVDEGQKCGGLPYFYNTKTKQCVCGATTFGNLRAWAKGKPCNMFYYIPDKNESKESQEKSRKSVGMLGRIGEKVSEMKKEGKEQMVKRVEEEQRKRLGKDKIEEEVDESED